ncbi:MAG TPA: hypothetical protein VKE98_09515, partial [Gemmataceae bacterium]|nr:hypothetical protein [Gemmataceae bacterium]
PSGRRCRTFDDLAQGCQEEWPAARDLLHKGIFDQFLTVNGRADLVKVAQESKNQADPDIALVRFINALPVTRSQAPRLDLNPRRFLLGNVTAGEGRQLQVTISNQGQGVLQGTLKVSEGGHWLRLVGSANGQCSLRIAKDQSISLQVDTKGMPAAQTYGGKLTVITNGGVVEVPVRMDLMAQPFPRPPFHGAKTPREMAERMRAQPKAAVPLLENGEIARWFAGNGWNYPVRGTPVRGVAGIQQFFEAMGLSKPPAVMVAQPEVRFSCIYPQSQRFQVSLQTNAKKWVYASVESDSPWLKVLTPHVAGPKHASIAFEVDTRFLPGGRGEGRLKIQANAGQNLAIRVAGEARGGPTARKGGILPAVVSMVLACFILRLLLIPVADFLAPGPAARSAARSVDRPTDTDRLAQFVREQQELVQAGRFVGKNAEAQKKLAGKQTELAKRVQNFKPAPAEKSGPALAKAQQAMSQASEELMIGQPAKAIPFQETAFKALVEAGAHLTGNLQETGGWLTLPWARILLGSGTVDARLLNSVDSAPVASSDFRHYYLGSYIRRFVWWTWWVWGLLGMLILWRRGGAGDLLWGLIAGAAAGVAVSATLACAILVVEVLPHGIFQPEQAGMGVLIVWLFLVLITWSVFGVVLGLACGLFGPMRRIVLEPVQKVLARIFRICGLKGLAPS